MQHDFAVSHFVPELAEHLVQVLRGLGAHVVEDRRKRSRDHGLGPLLAAPVAVFIRFEYLMALQHAGVSPRYRLLKWALEDAVEAATLYPLRKSGEEEPRSAITLCCVFEPTELASFRFPPGLGRRGRERALARFFSVLETCAGAEDSLLSRARQRLGSGGWRLDLRFDEREGEWVVAGIDQDEAPRVQLATA